MITGPFLIKYTHYDENLFITISNEHDIQLTGDIKDAFPFFIRRVNDYSNYFEILSSYDQELHVTVMVDWRGHGLHPPKLRTDANGWSYMAIYNKKSQPKYMTLEDPSKCGEEETDAFYISCYAKPAYSKDASYLIVHRETKLWSNQVHYWIGCVPNIKHNRQDGEPMLFKFVKPPQEEERGGPPPPPARIQDDGGDLAGVMPDIDDALHIDVTAEMH